MPVVSKCFHCGLEFESRSFAAINSVGSGFISSGEMCPRCGRIARVMEGSYNFDRNGVATPVDAPQWSIDLLNRVQGKLRTAERIVANPALTTRAAHDKVIRYIDESIRPENPAVADVLSEKLDAKPRKKWVTVIRRMGVAVSLIVGAIGLVNDVVELPQSIEVAREWVSEAYEQAANGSPATPGAEPWHPRPQRGLRDDTDPGRGWLPTTTQGPTGKPDRESHQPRHPRRPTEGS